MCLDVISGKARDAPLTAFSPAVGPTPLNIQWAVFAGLKWRDVKLASDLTQVPKLRMIEQYPQTECCCLHNILPFIHTIQKSY
jgi:hypothetical protein